MDRKTEARLDALLEAYKSGDALAQAEIKRLFDRREPRAGDRVLVICEKCGKRGVYVMGALCPPDKRPSDLIPKRCPACTAAATTPA